jgi:two-component system, chemotaxis family, chemotaxis protein CheY
MAQILVVDDSTTMRQMVAFTLSSAGHEVTEAPDGNKALATAKQKKFDLVQSLRGLPDCKFIPILVLTTEAGSDLKQRGKSAGATGWIVKPFNPEVLLDTLKKVLD